MRRLWFYCFFFHRPGIDLFVQSKNFFQPYGSPNLEEIIISVMASDEFAQECDQEHEETAKTGHGANCSRIGVGKSIRP